MSRQHLALWAQASDEPRGGSTNRRGSALSDARQQQPATRLKRNEMVKKTPRSYIDVTVTCRRITDSCRRERHPTLTLATIAIEPTLLARAYSFLPEQIDRIFNKPPGAERCNLPALTPTLPALSPNEEAGQRNYKLHRHQMGWHSEITNIEGLESYCLQVFRWFCLNMNYRLRTCRICWSRDAPQDVPLTSNKPTKLVTIDTRLSHIFAVMIATDKIRARPWWL